MASSTTNRLFLTTLIFSSVSLSFLHYMLAPLRGTQGLLSVWGHLMNPVRHPPHTHTRTHTCLCILTSDKGHHGHGWPALPPLPNSYASPDQSSQAGSLSRHHGTSHLELVPHPGRTIFQGHLTQAPSCGRRGSSCLLLAPSVLGPAQHRTVLGSLFFRECKATTDNSDFHRSELSSLPPLMFM